MYLKKFQPSKGEHSQPVFFFHASSKLFEVQSNNLVVVVKVRPLYEVNLVELYTGCFFYPTCSFNLLIDLF